MIKPTTFHIALGSNKGDKFKNLQEAVDSIHLKIGNIKLISKVYKSPAFGFESDDFLNCCLFVVMLPRFLRAHGHAFSGLDEREFKGMGHRCDSPRLASVAGSGSCVLCCWFCCSFVHHLLPVRVSVVVRA